MAKVVKTVPPAEQPVTTQPFDYNGYLQAMLEKHLPVVEEYIELAVQKMKSRIEVTKEHLEDHSTDVDDEPEYFPLPFESVRKIYYSDRAIDTPQGLMFAGYGDFFLVVGTSQIVNIKMSLHFDTDEQDIQDDHA